ncbi:MAG: sulfotransferase [Planctomycetota bacterium]
MTQQLQQRIDEALRLLQAKQPALAKRVLEPLIPRLRKNAEVLRLFAIILIEAGETDKAVATITKAMKLRPMDADLAVAHAKVLSQAARFDEAIAAFERCLALQPTNTEAADGLVRALRLVRRDEDAVAVLQKAIDAGAPMDAFLATAAGEAALSDVNPGFDRGRAIDLITEVVASGRVPAGATAELAFRRGMLLDSERRFDEAFEAFAEANESVKASFNTAAHRRATDQLIERWDSHRLDAPACDTPDRHVFIVGMPRSGTTLVEQILAAHPDVATAGETLLLPAAARELGLARPPFEYPAATAEAKPADPVTASARFSASLRAAAKARTEQVTIDKLPINAFFVPIAATLFPNARFIGCLRDPRDVGLSCFQQNFGGGNRTMYDLTHIAHFQADTIRVMQHWAATIPDRFTLIEYEAVVGDLEAAARSLSQAAGVGFNDASLRYWESAKPINTASFEQASRPVYTSSIGRWKSYETHLAPLIDTLRDRGVPLP